MRELGIGILALATAGATAPFKTTIQADQPLQRITGFGASGAGGMAGRIVGYSEPTRSKLLDDFFDTTKGAGLSMVRNELSYGLNPGKDSWNWGADAGQRTLMIEARKRGATQFWSVPWSPPAWMKTTNSTRGGVLKPENYQDLADFFSRYVREYKSSYGIDIMGMSVQNEPQAGNQPWDCSYYSGDDLAKFIKENLGPTFARDGVKAKIIAPESNWNETQYADPVFKDADAAKYAGVAAFHEYGTQSVEPYPLAQDQGKELWETECSNYDANNAQGPGMAGAMPWVKILHGHLTKAQANAWHYWWLLNPTTSTDEGLATVDGGGYVATKRLWTLGNWGRFVRPGWRMVKVRDYNSPDGKIGISAFIDSAKTKLAIVAINFDPSASQACSLSVAGTDLKSVTPYLTDESNNLAAQSAIPIAKGQLGFTLPKYSVTTLVGSLAPGTTGLRPAGGAGRADFRWEREASGFRGRIRFQAPRGGEAGLSLLDAEGHLSWSTTLRCAPGANEAVVDLPAPAGMRAAVLYLDGKPVARGLLGGP